MNRPPAPVASRSGLVFHDVGAPCEAAPKKRGVLRTAMKGKAVDHNQMLYPGSGFQVQGMSVMWARFSCQFMESSIYPALLDTGPFIATCHSLASARL